MFPLQQEETNIVPWQGARGLDGEPGPQGVAGANVSVSQVANAFVFFPMLSV